MYVQRVHYGKLIVVLAVVVGFSYFSLQLTDRKVLVQEIGAELGEEKHEEMVRSENEAVSWTSLHTCPVCLGSDLCPDIQQGFISVGLFPKGKLGASTAYTAKLKVTDSLTALLQEQETWDQFDDWFCKSSEQWSNCLVSKAVSSSPLFRSDASASFLRRLGADRGVVRPLTVCSTLHLSSKLREAFDENMDDNFTKEERGMMYTTLSVAPSIAMLRVASRLGLSRVPRYIGSCGRVAIIEGDLTPLSDISVEDWSYRGDLASQILGLVTGLLTGEWILIGWELDWSTFAVTRTGQVVLSNLDSFTPVHRSLVSRPGDEIRDVCNAECFQKFKSRVLLPTPRGQPSSGCRDALLYGDLMYLQICRNIFQTGSRLGLLEGGGEELKGLLDECVEEKGKGERWRVVDEIRELLTKKLSTGSDNDVSDTGAEGSGIDGSGDEKEAEDEDAEDYDVRKEENDDIKDNEVDDDDEEEDDDEDEEDADENEDDAGEETHDAVIANDGQEEDKDEDVSEEEEQYEKDQLP